MLIEVHSSEHARILEMEGYNRAGGKAVEVQSIDEAKGVLGRDDVTVRKVALRRENSDEEAELIDSYIQNEQYGRITYYVPSAKTHVRAGKDFLQSNRKSGKITIKENKIVAEGKFGAILDGTFEQYPTEDEIEGAIETAEKAVAEKIEEHEQAIADLESELERLEGMDRETFVEQYC